MEPLLSLKEIEKILKVKKDTIFTKIKNKELNGFKVGREWRFEKAEIERFINQQKNK